MKSAIETKIDDLNQLRRRADTLEDAQRTIRLGGKVEMQYKRFFWKDMVYMFGWGRLKSEPLPVGIEADFYRFLAEQQRVTGEAIRALEAELATVSDAAS